MQTAHLLSGNAQHQPGSRMLGPDFHRHHALMGADSHGRQYPGCCSHTSATRRLALLQQADKPGQQGHGAHKKDDHKQRLGHAATIHD